MSSSKRPAWADPKPPTDEYYVYEREVWDEKKCRKENRRVFVDGHGTKGPRGLIQSVGEVYGYGTRRFNGGTDINGKWYIGYVRPYPELAPGYRLEQHPAWGTFILKEGESVADAIFRS